MPSLNELAAWAQIFALPVAVIAIIVSVWLYLRGRQRRALACEFGPIESPVEIKAGKALQGGIEIRYRGQPVENLFLVQARLKNIGNVSIHKSDIVEPVTFTFGPAVELLREPQVIAKIPENLKISWRFRGTDPRSKPHAISLDFDLLNQGDELTVEFTCTGKSTSPQVTARIEGIKRIELLDLEEVRLRQKVTENMVMLTLVLATAVVGMVVVGILVVERASAVIPEVQKLGTGALELTLPLWVIVVLIGWLLTLFAVFGLWFFVGEPILKLVQYRRSKKKS